MTVEDANNLPLPESTQADAGDAQRYDGAIGNNDQPEPVADQLVDGGSLNLDMHDDHQRQREMVGAMLDGTFDENLRTHAENLAEKLIQRQQELDRREAQLNRMSAEMENDLRQSRLNVQLIPHSNHETAAAETISTTQTVVAGETPTTDSAETSPVDELLTIRIDKYCEAQRQPYSKFNARVKKYADASKGNRVSSLDEQAVEPTNGPSNGPTDDLQESSGTFLFDGQLDPFDAGVEMPDPILLSINQLTDSATVIRRRSEEVDAMYEQLTGIFSEMLRQQGALRELTTSLSNFSSIEDAGQIQTLRNELDRLTIQLTMVGRDHFLLPMEIADAA